MSDLTGDPEVNMALVAERQRVAAQLLPVHQLISKVKREIGSVGKSGKMKPKPGDDKGPTYAFRRIDDILDEAHEALCDYGVFWVPHRILDATYTSSGKAQECILKLQYRVYGPRGDFIEAEVIGQAVDYGSDKATGKSYTMAEKILLTQLFAIPYSAADPDDERPQRVDEQAQSRRPTENDPQDWPAEAKATARKLEARLDGLPAPIADRVLELIQKEAGTTVGAVDELPPSWLPRWDYRIGQAEAKMASDPPPVGTPDGPVTSPESDSAPVTPDPASEAPAGDPGRSRKPSAAELEAAMAAGVAEAMAEGPKYTPEQVAAMTKPEVVTALVAVGLPTAGTVDVLRKRLTGEGN